MVYYGEVTTPSFVDDNKRNQVENGITTSANFKKFKDNRVICFSIYILIIIAIFSRASTIDYTKRNDMLSWYQALSMLSLVLLPNFVPSKDEILPFHVFAKPVATGLCIFDVLFGASTIFLAAPLRSIPAIVANMITFVLLTYLGSHFRISDYNPFENNKKYIKSRTIYRTSEHGLKIKESRPFLIVLENTGSQSIALAGLSLERCTIVENRRSFVKFKLSQEGAINYGQTIMIVPKTEKNDSLLSAVAVPRFRCFGVDAGERITTKLTTDKKNLAQMEEHFELKDDSFNTNGFSIITEVVNTVEGEKTVDVK